MTTLTSARAAFADCAKPTGTDFSNLINLLFDDYNSVSAMVADAGLEQGQYVRTHGYRTPGDRGGNLYEIVSAAAGTDDGGSFIDLSGISGQAKGLFPEGKNVMQFGARGDGSTDDASDIQSAMDSLSSGETLIFPPNTYRVDTRLNGTTSNVTFLFRQAKIDFSNANITHDLFLIKGTAATSVVLQTDASALDTTVSVASGGEAGFAAGSYAKVTSDDVYDASNVGVKLGEIVEVKSTTDGSITFTTPLQGGTYTTANSAKVTPITPVQGVSFIGGRFVGNSTTVDNTNSQVAIKVVTGRRILVQNCEVVAFNAIGVQYEDCIESQIVGNHITHSQRPSSGYGVETSNACHDIIVRDNHFRICRHGFTTSNNSPQYGINRRIQVISNTLNETVNTGDGFDTHGAAEDILFENNTVINSTGSGINLECRSGVIRGNTIKKTTQYGIEVHNESDLAGDVIVEGNIIEDNGSDTGDDGIRVQQGGRGTTAVYNSIIVRGNRIVNAAGTGIKVDDQNADQTNVLVADNFISNAGNVNGAILVTESNNVIINSNIIQLSKGYGVQISNVSGAVVSDNFVELDTLTNPGYWAYRVNATNANDTLDVVVANNIMTVNGSAGTTKGVDVSDNADWVHVADNNVRAANTGIDLGSGANNTQVDNVT